MGYYADGPPRHSHRSPAEIAEDEILAALRGDFCGVLTPADACEPHLYEPRVIPRRLALVPWADRPRTRRWSILVAPRAEES